MALSFPVGHGDVLVVEDDEPLRELYRTALQAAGFAVVAVEDGLSALRCVEAAKPSVVVLDLELTQLGGSDVQQELRAHPDTQHIPIVIVSGKDTSAIDPKDVACILRKPISTDELIAAVQRCMRPWTS